MHWSLGLSNNQVLLYQVLSTIYIPYEEFGFDVAISTLRIEYEEPEKNIWKDADMMMKYLNK